MTKSIETQPLTTTNGTTVSPSKQEQLLALMDKSKLSLIKAARLTGIPYEKAKQILFIHGSSRAVVRGLSNSTRISPRAKETKQNTLFKAKGFEQAAKIRLQSFTGQGSSPRRVTCDKPKSEYQHQSEMSDARKSNHSSPKQAPSEASKTPKQCRRHSVPQPVPYPSHQLYHQQPPLIGYQGHPAITFQPNMPPMPSVYYGHCPGMPPMSQPPLLPQPHFYPCMPPMAPYPFQCPPPFAGPPPQMQPFPGQQCADQTTQSHYNSAPTTLSRQANHSHAETVQDFHQQYYPHTHKCSHSGSKKINTVSDPFDVNSYSPSTVESLHI